MATHEEKQWWEFEGRPAARDTQFEAEAQGLRQERTRTWRDRADERERRRSRTSVPPPAAPRRWFEGRAWAQAALAALRVFSPPLGGYRRYVLPPKKRTEITASIPVSSRDQVPGHGMKLL